MDLEEERVQVGLRLKAARLDAKVTQGEAAEAVGVQRPAISMWEHGHSLPSLLQFKVLAALYGVLTHRLLFGRSPVELSASEARELCNAARNCSPRLRAKVDVMATLLTSKNADEATKV